MTDISSGKVPVVECVVASWRFFFENWLRFLPAAAIVGIMSGGAPVLLVGGMAAAQRASLGLFLSFLVSAVAGVFFTAAVLRKAVRDEYVPPTGLSFGADETRLLGVLAGMAALFVPPIFLFSMLLVIVIFGRIASSPEQLETLTADPAALERAVAEALSTPAGMVIQVVGLIFLGVLIVVSARLYMVNAATIGERRTVFFQTWNWSRGNVFRVLASVILTALPTALFNMIVGSILSGTSGAQQNVMTAIVIDSALSIIAALGSIPSIALGAQLYKGLRPPGFAPK
jgi:hypothetical protein